MSPLQRSAKRYANDICHRDKVKRKNFLTLRQTLLPLRNLRIGGLSQTFPPGFKSLPADTAEYAKARRVAIKVRCRSHNTAVVVAKHSQPVVDSDVGRRRQVGRLDICRRSRRGGEHQKPASASASFARGMRDDSGQRCRHIRHLVGSGGGGNGPTGC